MIRKPYTVIDPLTVPIKVNNKKFLDLIALQTEINKFNNALREEIRRIFRLMDEKDISIEEACRILQIDEKVEQ